MVILERNGTVACQMRARESTLRRLIRHLRPELVPQVTSLRPHPETVRFDLQAGRLIEQGPESRPLDLRRSG